MNTHSIAWKKYQELAQTRPETFRQVKHLMIETDEQKVIQYEKEHSVTIGVLYESAYHILVVDLVYDSSGRYFTYERLLPAIESGACVMLPIYQGRIILMKQYRHALREFQYAIPRGFAEPHLSAEQNCQKEMHEELGASLRSILPLGVVAADSGIQGSKANVYACYLSAFEPQLYHEGIQETIALTPNQLEEWIQSGRITDAYTLSAYMLYRAHSKTN